MARKKWTEEENNILRKYYRTMGSAIVNYLPGRTYKACQAQASKLGCTYERVDWTKEEIDLLVRYWANTGRAIARYLPKRTATACARKAAELGLPRLR